MAKFGLIMKLQCHITPEDYVRGQFLHVRPRPAIKWAGLMIVVAALAIGIQELVFPPSGTLAWKPFAILVALAYFYVLYAVMLPWKTRKIYKQQKSLQEPYESELTDDAYSFASIHGAATMPWSMFHKYKISKDTILLYQSDAIYHLFPKRWFTEEQFAEFQSILQKHLGQPIGVTTKMSNK